MTTDEAIALLLAEHQEAAEDLRRVVREFHQHRGEFTEDERALAGLKLSHAAYRETHLAIQIIALHRVNDDGFTAELAAAVDDPDYLSDWLAGIASKRGISDVPVSPRSVLRDLLEGRVSES